ncbi:MAG: hypothetical protein ACK46O_03570 [Flavobacteriia bacterium]
MKRELARKDLKRIRVVLGNSLNHLFLEYNHTARNTAIAAQGISQKKDISDANLITGLENTKLSRYRDESYKDE